MTITIILTHIHRKCPTFNNMWEALGLLLIQVMAQTVASQQQLHLHPTTSIHTIGKEFFFELLSQLMEDDKIDHFSIEVGPCIPIMHQELLFPTQPLTSL